MKRNASLYKILYNLLPLISVISFLTIWQMIASVQNSSMPSPVIVLERLISCFQAPVAKVSMIAHIWISFWRVVGALLIAIIVGIPFGIMLGWSPTFNGILGPVFEIIRPIPPIAWVPLVTVWFGVGEFPRMLLCFIAVFTPIVINSYAGVTMIPQLNVDVALSFGASKRQLFFDIVIPSSLPAIFAGIRTALSSGWTVLVAAEMISANSGLGFLITRGSGNGDLALAMVAMVFIGLLGALLSLGFDYLEGVICIWKKKR